MKKTINVNKLSKSKRDAIIKVDSEIIAIVKEVEMSSKAPGWFTSWSKEFEKKNDERWNRQEEFNKNQLQFNKEIKQDIEAIKNCPTIKKELA